MFKLLQGRAFGPRLYGAVRVAAVPWQDEALLPGVQDAQAPDDLEREESVSVRHGFLLLVLFSKAQNPHPPQGCKVFQAKVFKVKFKVFKVKVFQGGEV